MTPADVKTKNNLSRGRPLHNGTTCRRETGATTPSPLKTNSTSESEDTVDGERHSHLQKSCSDTPFSVKFPSKEALIIVRDMARRFDGLTEQDFKHQCHRQVLGLDDILTCEDDAASSTIFHTSDEVSAFSTGGGSYFDNNHSNTAAISVSVKVIRKTHLKVPR